MAVPFVQDWDLVQTLGEGAYGEYESSFMFIVAVHQYGLVLTHFDWGLDSRLGTTNAEGPSSCCCVVERQQGRP